jgi:hypothetical protein
VSAEIEDQEQTDVRRHERRGQGQRGAGGGPRRGGER